ncbi:MAG: cell division protein FtsZ [Helicobacter sp.]|uniref:cell division protein FtsZ n=1 Tax=Helicobacter sp. 10-6591 TaxID=2004998 RepID=UPI000DCC436C|nr:cell division protein FtsZ [Helicobacter sp. 10-6591]MCI6217294.1 cell division protein FtsZ [Helicobacter sp.]MCI7485038.1 cell division protein FtsZ [Helicobacter sp.]MDD7567389.1 cell division protein FtsZ [Helicobacter sp.]MDY5741366.1 cell division protein FtsZ [Helicobacter sp.]RAX55663.1 cell division protein FtsZ [Helicobacter sp. 10-6591]
MQDLHDLNIQELGDEIAYDGCRGAKIAAIGVGGGGSNTINYLVRKDTRDGITIFAANTDSQHLAKNSAKRKIQLGKKLTRGLGAGAKPEVGEQAALESFDEIKEALKGFDIVFIAAGLGGGTGTGAAPLIAKAAKENDALAVSIVTKPFKSEGRKRAKIAEEGLRKLREESDCIIVVLNDRMVSAIGNKDGQREAMNMVNDVLADAVIGLSNIILGGSADDTNVDFADVRTVMENKGLSIMTIGEYTGEDAAKNALKQALESPMLGNVSIHGATGIIMCLETHPDYPYKEIDKARSEMLEYETDETDFVFGSYSDESLAIDSARITIIATGFQEEITDAPENKNLNMTSVPQVSSLRVSSGETLFSATSYDRSNLDVPACIRKQQD